MSEMRNHLDAARGAYQATRYPGDLGSQVLAGRRNIWPRIVGTIVAGAAAAVIVVVLMNQSIEPTKPLSVKIAPPTTQEITLNTLPGVPEMPQANLASSSLDGPIFLPSLPGFPTLSEVTAETTQTLPTTNQTPTTQEAL